MKPTLVILAAGAGTRYGGLKQLAGVGPHDEALLEYSAFDALRAGFGRVVLVVREETEAAFRGRLEVRMASRVSVTYVHQSLGDLGVGRAKPWGTGHAVLTLESAVTGPFAVINADDFYGAEPYLALASFLTESHGQRAKLRARRLAVVGFRLADTLTDSGAVSRALLEVDREARLRSIVEHPEISKQDNRIVSRDDSGRESVLGGEELVSMNMWGFTAELLPELRSRFAAFLEHHGNDPAAEFLLPEVIQALVAEGRFEVDVLPAVAEWCGVTFREDLERVQSVIRSMIAQGRYPEALWS